MLSTYYVIKSKIINNVIDYYLNSAALFFAIYFYILT